MVITKCPNGHVFAAVTDSEKHSTEQILHDVWYAAQGCTTEIVDSVTWNSCDCGLNHPAESVLEDYKSKIENR